MKLISWNCKLLFNNLGLKEWKLGCAHVDYKPLEDHTPFKTMYNKNIQFLKISIVVRVFARSAVLVSM